MLYNNNLYTVAFIKFEKKSLSSLGLLVSWSLFFFCISSSCWLPNCHRSADCVCLSHCYNLLSPPCSLHLTQIWIRCIHFFYAFYFNRLLFNKQIKKVSFWFFKKKREKKKKKWTTLFYLFPFFLCSASSSFQLCETLHSLNVQRI